MDIIINILWNLYPVYPFLLLFIYGFYEAGKLQMSKMELFFEDLPDEFDGFKILHISDLHSVRFGRLEKKLCKLIANQSFDIAVFTGDYLVRGVSRRARILEVLKKILFHISAPTGFYGIRGNHDKNKFMKQILKHTYITLLMEKAMPIKRGESEIWIAGVNRMKPQKRERGLKSINKALEGIPKYNKVFTILLAHTPDYIHLAAERDVNLVLAGDTHGGQICLPILGPLRNKAKTGKRFIKGLNRVSQTTIYTSRGIGATGLPVRFLCPPEVSVFTLRKREKAFQTTENLNVEKK